MTLLSLAVSPVDQKTHVFRRLIICTLVFAAVGFMSACDGSSSVIEPSSPSPGSDNNGTGDTDTDQTPPTTGNEAIIPLIGQGVGDAFINNQIDISSGRISAGAEVGINATLVNPVSRSVVDSQSYTVTVTSPCIESGRSTISANPLTVSDGRISLTYQATGCVGNDIITLAVSNSSSDQTIVSASAAVEIASPEVNQISQQSISSQQLGIDRLSNPILPRQAVIDFQVIDRFGNAIEGINLNFSLDNSALGAELATNSATTNNEGIATARLNSGRGKGVVRVIASMTANDGQEIINYSSPVSITTGFPDSDSFWIGADKNIVWGWRRAFADSEIQISVYAGDGNQNRVPDGTIVNFIASAGQIESSCAMTDGGCSVTWRTGFPLPGSDLSDGSILQTTDANHPEIDGGAVLNPSWQGSPAGIAHVMAYTVGSASYFDGNGNGIYDGAVDTPSVVHYPEAYIDVNDNNMFDPDEINNPREDFIDYDANGELSPEPSYFQGFNCSATLIASGSLDCSQQMHVRDTVSVVFANDSVFVDYQLTAGSKLLADISQRGPGTDYTCGVNTVNGSQFMIRYTMTLSDINYNGVAPGTSITLTAPQGFEIKGDSELTTDELQSRKPILQGYLVASVTEPIVNPTRLEMEITTVSGIKRLFPIGPTITNNGAESIDSCRDNTP